MHSVAMKSQMANQVFLDNDFGFMLYNRISPLLVVSESLLFFNILLLASFEFSAPIGSNSKEHLSVLHGDNQR